MVVTTNKKSESGNADETTTAVELDGLSLEEPPVSVAEVSVTSGAEECDDDIFDGAVPDDEALDWITGAEEPGSGRWKRFTLIAVSALVLLGLLSGLGVLGALAWNTHRLNAARDGAQKAAVDYAMVLTSVDSGNLDQNFAQVLDGATGKWKDQYSAGSTELKQLLVDNKASAKGQVLESAVQSADTNKVVVLLFVDQAVANAKVPDPRLDRSRMKMTMEYVDGRWRASDVSIL